VVKDITDFLKKRAEIESAYARSLAALCKTVPGVGGGLFGGSNKSAPVERENKTLKAALLSLQEEGLKASNAHQEFTNKIVSEVLKPLDTFIKTKELERKKFQLEGQKRLKALADAKSQAEKAREAFQRATKELEAANKEHEKAKNDLVLGPDNKRLQETEKRIAGKIPAIADKVKASETAYLKAVEATNEVITKSYSEHIPPLIDGLQQLETDRYSLLQTVLQEFVTLQRTIPSNLEERCQELDKRFSEVDVEADFNDFIETHKATAKEPELVKPIGVKETPKEEEKEKEKEKEGEPEKEAEEQKEEEDDDPAGTGNKSIMKEEELF